MSDATIQLSWGAAPGDVLHYGVFTSRDGSVPGDDAELVVPGPSAELTIHPGEQLVVRVAAIYAGEQRGPYSPASEVIELHTGEAPELDLNGDGRTDALWRDPSTGAPIVWFMRGDGLGGEGGTAAPPPGADFAGSADFDQDGTSDLAWTDPSTGSLVVWFMREGAVVDEWTAVERGEGFRARVLGDASENGFARVAWWNRASGAVDHWEINGRNIGDPVAKAQPLFDLLDPEETWNLERGCDLNGDGRRELIWRQHHPATGVVLGYAATFVPEEGGAEVRTVGIDLGGGIVRGCGAFAQESKEGLLCEAPDGSPGVWHMVDSSRIYARGELTQLPAASEAPLTGLGDFDGDGDSDLLFVASEDAQGEVVTLDGLSFASSEAFEFSPAELRSFEDPMPAAEDRN